MIAVAFTLEGNAGRFWINVALGQTQWFHPPVMAHIAKESLEIRGAFRQIWAWYEGEVEG